MTKIIYPELSYTVQGALYDVYNELRYFDLSEEGWENASLANFHAPSLEIETVRI